MWLHRRAEDPSTTDVQCYWKKPELSTVGTSLKFLTAKELGRKNVEELSPSNGEFLAAVVNRSKSIGRLNTELTKYYKEFSKVEKMSFHYLINVFPDVRNSDVHASEFLNFCRSQMSEAACLEAETQTVMQSKNSLWYELRYARITASKAYDAAHCQTFTGTLLENILGASKFKVTEAMQRGISLESQVLREVENKLKIKFKNCGLLLSSDYPFIGASPDGVSNEAVVEIKCPSSEKTLKRYIKANNKITAKYAAQVQMQMMLFKKNECFFCVASPDFERTKNVNIINVTYDAEYCKTLLEKCELFWYHAVFPALLKTVVVPKN